MRNLLYFPDPMLSLPIPFVVALLLAILFVRLWARSESRWASRYLLLLIGCCVILSLLAGLRWAHWLTALIPAQLVLAAAIPPLIWLSFATLRRDAAPRPLVHAIPVAMIVLLRFVASGLVDRALFLVYVGYALSLLWLATRGPASVDRAPLDRARAALNAMAVAGLALLAFAVLDLFVAMEIAGGNDAGAQRLVGLVNLGMLLALGVAAALAGTGDQTEELGRAEPAARAAPLDPARGEEIAARIEALMRDQRLFLDPNLTLSRIARRAGSPARQASMAINDRFGLNVSHYVNAHRIEEARRLLADDELSVTDVMYRSGFQTKSNFNREFLRVTGMTPSAWRASLPRTES